MFEIEKSYTFEAGHSLLHHDGKCRHPHGHSYLLTIRLRSKKLEESGPKKNMVLDFSDISAHVKPMIEKYLDHKWLNDTLQTDSPSAEFIAQWIFIRLKPKLAALFSVSVHETATSKATYFESFDEVEDIETLEALERAEDIRIAEARIKIAESDGTLSSKELKKRLGL